MQAYIILCWQVLSYIAGDDYNNLYSLLRLLLIHVIFKFYAYLKVGSL